MQFYSTYYLFLANFCDLNINTIAKVSNDDYMSVTDWMYLLANYPTPIVQC